MGDKSLGEKETLEVFHIEHTIKEEELNKEVLGKIEMKFKRVSSQTIPTNKMRFLNYPEREPVVEDIR